MLAAEYDVQGRDGVLMQLNHSRKLARMPRCRFRADRVMRSSVVCAVSFMRKPVITSQPEGMERSCKSESALSAVFPHPDRDVIFRMAAAGVSSELAVSYSVRKIDYRSGV